MKKNLFAIFTIFMMFAGCSSDSDSDSETISLASQGNDLIKSTETVKSFTENKTDVKNSANPSMRIEASRKDLSIDDDSGIVKAYVDSGKGTNSVSNYGMTNFGLSEKSSGVEVEVYGNEYLRNVGINWFESKGKGEGAPMEFYWFCYTPKNEITIQFRHYNKSQNVDNYEKLATIKAENSHIDSTKRNILKIRTTDSGKVEFYANGFLIYSESVSKLAKSGNITICYQTVKDQEYTKQKPAIANWKFLKEEVVKN